MKVKDFSFIRKGPYYKDIFNQIQCYPAPPPYKYARDTRCLFIICVIVYNHYYCCYAKTSSSAVQKRHSSVRKPNCPLLLFNISLDTCIIPSIHLIRPVSYIFKLLFRPVSYPFYTPVLICPVSYSFYTPYPPYLFFLKTPFPPCLILSSYPSCLLLQLIFFLCFINNRRQRQLCLFYSII